MSKTLFNTNTFQSKNVRNSDDVGTLKVDTFKATNAILTNITNTELQAATAGVATNASNIATNTSNISTNAGNIATNTSNISTNAGNIATNTSAIAGKQDALTTGDGIDITGTTISFDGTLTQDVTTSGFVRANNLEYLDGGVVTDVKTKIDANASAITGKQDTLTEGNGIDITNNTVTFEGTSVTGDITTTGTITGATMNYVDGGVVTNIKDEIATKQDILTQANNGGTNITISATGVISATGGGATYTAEANGGLAVNASNEFSIDLTNSNSRFDFPQRIRIENDNTPQLLIEPASNTGQDAELELRGARNGSTTSFQARLLFSNYDNDLGGTRSMGEIVGKVTDHTLNFGGLGFYYYPITQIRTQGAFLSGAGNWTFGTSVQNNYKVQVEGNTNTTGNAVIGGTLQINGISNVRTAIEGKQDTISALSGGGLAINNNEISVDFSNTSAQVDIPQRVVIENNSTAQLIVKNSSSGNNAAITIRGENNSTSERQAQLRFENTLSGSTNDLAEIAGVVTNAGSNIGGLTFYNFADGSTRAEAMTMNNNGRFHFGSTFQDTYKLQVTGNTNFTGDNINGGNSYIKQGLILDPFDMGSTTFTNGRNDSAASDASRENIYIKFAPDAGVRDDWIYLRNIGGTNTGHLAFDFHDDNNDVRFSIRNVRSSGVTTDVITEVFKVLSTGITANTSIYRTPQQAFYNFGKTSMSNNRFGNGNRFVGTSSIRETGTSFSSHSNGSVTISQNGYYKIRVGANPVTDGYNDRLAFAVYLLIGSTDYFQNQNYNFHGYSYTRNSSDGAFGNINFEDCIYISSGTAIQVRTKLDTNNRNFDDQLTNSQMECYCNLQIERIAETDIS